MAIKIEAGQDVMVDGDIVGGDKVTVDAEVEAKATIGTEGMLTRVAGLVRSVPVVAPFVTKLGAWLGGLVGKG